MKNFSVRLMSLVVVVCACFAIICGCNSSHSTSLTDEQKAFLARCPEVSLSKIPANLRSQFIAGYESCRPRLEGDDVVMFSNDAEMATVTEYSVEKGTKTLDVGGQLLTEFRIKKAGPLLHSQICKNFSDAFILNFLRAAGR
jgi:hypothetical protein